MQIFPRRALLCVSILIAWSKGYGQQPKVTKDPKPDSVRSLKEVVVTGQKNNFIEYHVDKVVVNVNGLIGMSGGNAIDILNSSPGVFVDENGGISLKGRGGVIVYVDDRPLQLSGADAINYLRSLPSAMIDKIELMSNPSAKYNADGTAIINIKTKKIKTAGFNGNLAVSAGYGRYFKSTNSALLNYRRNRLNFFLNAGFTASNVYFQSFRQRQYNYPQLSYLLLQRVNETNHERGANYKLGVDYNAGKFTTIGVMYNGFVSPYKEMGKYNNHFYDPSGRPDSFTLAGSRYTVTHVRNAVNVNLRHLFSNARRELNVNLDYLQNGTRPQQTLTSNFYLPADSFVKQNTFITRIPFNAVIYSAKADLSDTIFSNVKIETGVQSIYSVRSNSSSYFTGSDNVFYPDEKMTNKFRYREHIQSAYLNLQGNYKRLSVQVGLRAERTEGNALQYAMPLKPDTTFSVQYTNLFPTAYFMYKADSSGNNLISFSVGKRIERPGYSELNPSSFYFDRNTSNTGNSLLQPAFTTNMELVYNYKSKFITGITYNNTNDYISRGYKQVDDAFIAMPVNLHRYTSIGVNVTWQPVITRWWTLNLYNEVTNNRYTGNLIVNGESTHNKNLATFYVRAYNRFKFGKGFTADLTTIYRSKVILWQSSVRPIWQMHAGVQKKINEKATLNLAARDIFHSWKLRRDITIPYAQVHYHLEFDTQRFDLTFSYRFGKATGNKERRTGIEAESGRVH
jgi:iron complex outermembrane receptor protein